MGPCRGRGMVGVVGDAKGAGGDGRRGAIWSEFKSLTTCLFCFPFPSVYPIQFPFPSCTSPLSFSVCPSVHPSSPQVGPAFAFSLSFPSPPLAPSMERNRPPSLSSLTQVPPQPPPPPLFPRPLLPPGAAGGLPPSPPSLSLRGGSRGGGSPDPFMWLLALCLVGLAGGSSTGGGGPGQRPGRRAWVSAASGRSASQW